MQAVLSEFCFQQVTWFSTETDHAKQLWKGAYCWVMVNELRLLVNYFLSDFFY